MLGMGEGCLLPVFGVEAGKRGGEGAALGMGVAVGCMGLLFVPLAWRVWVLGVRPELLGRYVEEGGKKDE